ncbi:flagellar protein [Bradyrhizobium erythrophlei]|jgi:flagellar hook-associated protein 3 FlgL|uniref:Flagellin FlgL n=1 Tax=Bradyrhizobium erythrophlei TaxID=1437360 RepID=A0A1M7UIS9_9BRAD|nr:flagellar protein [Bradyrhizobium erythrophlei]SHN82858.1 Flagellin FlgL [Bradyrhizobium erythrophlei]
MSINSIGFNNSLFGQAVQNLNSQLTNLSTQLATGEKSTTYSGMGLNEGFAIAARSQLSNISAFTTTITNVNTSIGAANTALQSLSNISTAVKNDAASTPQDLNSTGQTVGQQNALSQLSSVVGILNTQAGDRFLFSGSAIDTPAVADVNTILNGTGTKAGLKQLIAERAQADGTTGLGRLVISSPTTSGGTTSFSVAEDAAGSPFGLKLSTVTSNLTGATVTGPAGSPAAVSFSFGATNPNPGDQVTLNFNLPDGTTSSVTLTASNTTPAPANTFAIGSTPAQTAANLNSALNTAIGTVANTDLVAASAVAAGNDFFDPSSSATGSVATNQQTPAAPITSATKLSGTAPSDSLTAGFQNGDSISVNGTAITFSTSSPTSLTGPTYNINPTTGTVGNLLSAIDSITGTTTPSSIDGGAITLNTPNAASFSISGTTANATSALSSLGFSSSPITAPQPPLRVSGSPLSSATSLVNGSASTVAWYTGNSSADPRASSNARIDSGITVNYGAQANEQAIRQQLEGIAVYAAVSFSPTAANSPKQAAALSLRISNNLTSQPGQQTIADIQTDYAAAQTQMQAASARQSQTQTVLQNLVDSTETVSTDQVASEILQLQTTLSASYQTTSILAGLSLTKFLAPGG